MKTNSMLPALKKHSMKPGFKGTLNIDDKVKKHERGKHPKEYNKCKDIIENYVTNYLPKDHNVHISYAGENTKKPKLTHSYPYKENGSNRTFTKDYYPNTRTDKLGTLATKFINATKKEDYYIDRGEQVKQFNAVVELLGKDPSVSDEMRLVHYLNNSRPHDLLTLSLDGDKKKVRLMSRYDLKGEKHELPSQVSKDEYSKKSEKTIQKLVKTVAKLPKGEYITLSFDDNNTLKLEYFAFDKKSKSSYTKEVYTTGESGNSKEERVSIQLAKVCNDFIKALTPQQVPQEPRKPVDAASTNKPSTIEPSQSDDSLTSKNSEQFDAYIDGSLPPGIVGGSTTPHFDPDNGAGTSGLRPEEKDNIEENGKDTTGSPLLDFLIKSRTRNSQLPATSTTLPHSGDRVIMGAEEENGKDTIESPLLDFLIKSRTKNSQPPATSTTLPHSGDRDSPFDVPYAFVDKGIDATGQSHKSTDTDFEPAPFASAPPLASATVLGAAIGRVVPVWQPAVYEAELNAPQQAEATRDVAGTRGIPDDDQPATFFECLSDAYQDTGNLLSGLGRNTTALAGQAGRAAVRGMGNGLKSLSEYLAPDKAKEE